MLIREQKCSSTLNVITGFHVMDGENHILVLEGLKSGAILMLQRDIGCDTVESNYMTILLFTLVRCIYTHVIFITKMVALYACSVTRLFHLPLVYMPISMSTFAL